MPINNQSVLQTLCNMLQTNPNTAYSSPPLCNILQTNQNIAYSRPPLCNILQTNQNTASSRPPLCNILQTNQNTAYSRSTSTQPIQMYLTMNHIHITNPNLSYYNAHLQETNPDSLYTK